MRTWRIPAAVGALLAATACVPLTLSSEDAFDFGTYKSVYVPQITGDVEPSSHGYLVDELTRRSGFERVGTDETHTADLVLWIDVGVIETIDDDESTEYDSEAAFTLQEWSGKVVRQGTLDASSGSRSGAIEAVLNEVVDHFQRGYRL